MRSLYDRLKEVTDPRSSRKKKHDCAEMLTYVIMGFICGRIALRRTVAWAKSNEKILKKHLKLRGGIASVSTLSRLLSGIDEEIFALVFADWAAQLLNGCGFHIIIDGKALRAATKKIRNGNAPYLLNAIEATTELVIAQMPIDAKTNEITTIPKLLDWINIRGNTITIDAIGTQTDIMGKIEEQGAGFVFQVKKNQPQMYQDIMEFFRELETEKAKAAENSSYNSPMKEQMEESKVYKTNEKNRERHEYRECTISHDVSCLTNFETVPYIKTIGMSRQIRRMIVRDNEGNDITPDIETFLREGSLKQPVVKKGDAITDNVQEIGIVSNMIIGAKAVGEFRRNHWKIENNLHHVLDDVFREDRSPAKDSKYNLALVRKIAYNIIHYALNRLTGHKGVMEMMDWFADNPERLFKYIFEPSESITAPGR